MPGDEFIVSIVKLYREEKDVDLKLDGVKKYFSKGKYVDVAGLCKVATIKEIAEQNYSLNPGRYVGVTEKAADDFDFYEKLEELNEELEVLNSEAHELGDKIAENVTKLLEANS